MSRQLSPERRKVVVIAAAVASGSGISALLMNEHRWVGFVWLGLMVVALAYVMVQLVKIKKADRARRMMR